MKNSLHFILLIMFMAQVPSELMGMQRKRSIDAISGKEESGLAEGEQTPKRHADKAIPVTPLAQYPVYTTVQLKNLFETEILPDSDDDTISDDYTTEDELDIAPPNITKLNDETLKDLTLEEWRYRPMISDDFIYLSQKYLANMHSLYKNSTWLCNTFPDTQIDKVLHEDIYDAISEVEIKPFIPCIAKMVIPQDTHTAIIGDVHGDIETIESLFLSFHEQGFINNSLYMPINSRIIFLGDFTDRGGFSMQVLRALLILAVKNPGQVFLLKGNHETIYSNMDDGILDEINNFEKDTKKQNIMIQNLAKIYEFMPAAMLLGFAGQEQTPFYFLAHGGPDIRYDYTDLLKLNEEELAKNGGLCFWNLTEDDLLKTDLSNLMFNSIKYQIRRDKETNIALNLHISKNLIHGFLWNDIDIDRLETTLPIYPSNRGKGCISLNLDFIELFLKSFTNEKNKNTKFVGLIRGHQHAIAKQVGKVELQTLSPSCCCFSPQPTESPILTTKKPILLANTFSTTIVISGPIIIGGVLINYLPTFLDLKFLGNNTWQFEAVEYEAIS